MALQKILNLISVFIICEPDCATTTKLPTSLHLWSWESVNDKCLPVKKMKLDEVMQSLETCNILCSNIHIWPLPTGVVDIGKTAAAVHPQSFNVEILNVPSETVREHIKDAFQLFKDDLQNKKGGLGGESNVVVQISVVGNKDPRMRHDTDESYQLQIGPATPVMSSIIVSINAFSYCGARHALETLSQLIWLDHYMDSLLMIQEAKITDKPKFSYRGLMIDTARHFIPLKELMRTLDAMAATKLNTLHWHATDSQAFPLQLNSAPYLAKYGAYSPTDVYTSQQIRALARRARLRGIRLLIEIDTPAHVSNTWSNLFSEETVYTPCFTESRLSQCDDPPCGQLTPSNPFTFAVLQNIYTEIVDLTGVDDIFHLGGDDVFIACWAAFNGPAPMSVWLDYTRSLIQKISSIKPPNITLFWFSPLSQRIKIDLKDLRHIIAFQITNDTWADKLGDIKTVVSNADAWDLNSGYGLWYDHNKRRSFNSWQRVYEYRPWAKSDQKILGGEATLWSWDVNEGAVNERVWPRASALAERLWSDPPRGATAAVHARLDMHRSRMAARGLQCAPIWSQWCTQHPYSCT